MTTRAPIARPIPLALVPDYMRQIRPFLEAFAERDLEGETAEGFEAMVRRGVYQVWCLADWKACALTIIRPEAVLITHCGGRDREEWQEAFDDAVSEWCVSIGRKRVISSARPGWTRFAKSRGYRETHREFVKEVA